jgi:DNA-binding NarL/FixJ family response regulator
MNSNFRWTNEDDGRLVVLKAAGASNSKIANTLERTVSSIEQRLAILKKMAERDSINADRRYLDGRG